MSTQERTFQRSLKYLSACGILNEGRSLMHWWSSQKLFTSVAQSYPVLLSCWQVYTSSNKMVFQELIYGNECALGNTGP